MQRVSDLRVVGFQGVSLDHPMLAGTASSTGSDSANYQRRQRQRRDMEREPLRRLVDLNGDLARKHDVDVCGTRPDLLVEALRRRHTEGHLYTYLSYPQYLLALNAGFEPKQRDRSS
jgi:hypothetical protein